MGVFTTLRCDVASWLFSGVRRDATLRRCVVASAEDDVTTLRCDVASSRPSAVRRDATLRRCVVASVEDDITTLRCDVASWWRGGMPP